MVKSRQQHGRLHNFSIGSVEVVVRDKRDSSVTDFSRSTSADVELSPRRQFPTIQTMEVSVIFPAFISRSSNCSLVPD